MSHEEVAYLREKLKSSPESGRLHRLLAALLADIPGERKQAIRHLRIALSLNPSDVQSLCDIAVLLMKEGKAAGALCALQLALRINGNHFPSLMTLSALHFSRGNYGQSEEFARKAVKSRPQHAGARRNLARVLAQIGKVEDAARANEEALQLSEHAPTYGKLAIQSLQLQCHSRAKECIARRRSFEGRICTELSNSEKTAELMRHARLMPT